MERYRLFLVLLGSAVLLGFLSVVFTLVWVLRYREGLAWDGTAAEFNWHPVLVVTGFVFVEGIVADEHDVILKNGLKIDPTLSPCI